MADIAATCIKNFEGLMGGPKNIYLMTFWEVG